MAVHNKEPKLAADCKNHVLNVYQHKIKQQNQLVKAVKAVLTETLAEHVLYCVLSGRELLIYTDGEEWITQLSSYQSVLLTAIANDNFVRVERVQIRLFSNPVAQKTTTNVKLPSKKNIELLRENLATVNDEGLKQALSRLSQTLDRLSK